MFNRNVLYSLVLHALLCLPFFFVKKPLEVKTIPVEIEIKAAVPVKKQNGVKAAGKPAGQLFPVMNAQTLLAKVERNSQNSPKHFSDSGIYQSDISEVFGENGNKNWAYHREIYRRIDSNLMFDSILAQYNHFGRVYVQFKVNEQGQLDVDNLSAEARNPILKVHVLRAIRKSLLTPIENIDREKLFELGFFQAEFNFRYGDHNENFSKQSSFGRPVFVFNRATTEKPVPKEMLDHLLSGGVTPNISQMYERWQKYNKKKHLEAIQFDPFENYRTDAFYQL